MKYLNAFRSLITKILLAVIFVYGFIVVIPALVVFIIAVFIAPSQNNKDFAARIDEITTHLKKFEKRVK